MKTILLTLVIGSFVFAATGRAAEPVKPYALDTCLIAGERLGEMGPPVVIVYQGQEIKFCCKNCEGTFEKDPAAGLKKYQAAVAAKASGGATPAP